jgi:hypothetical protein
MSALQQLLREHDFSPREGPVLPAGTRFNSVMTAFTPNGAAVVAVTRRTRSGTSNTNHQNRHRDDRGAQDA